MPGEDSVRSAAEDIEKGGTLYRYHPPLVIARGSVGILAGIVLLFWPTAGIAVVAVTLGIFLTADGVERLVTFFRHPGKTRRVEIIEFVGSLLRLILGALIMLRPADTGEISVVLIFILAGLNLILGTVISLWELPSLKKDPVVMALIVTMQILGLLMILVPMFTALFLLRLLGVALVLGAVPSFTLGLRRD